MNLSSNPNFDLLSHDIGVIEAYADCAARHKALVDALKNQP